MNLGKKKELAARTFGVGKGRIIFLESRKEDIKEAITKQDLRDLHTQGAIQIKEVVGRKKVQTTNNRSTGNVRKKVNRRKKDYVTMTRKLRKYTKNMKEQGKVTPEEAKEIRKVIRNKGYKSKASLRDHIGGLQK